MSNPDLVTLPHMLYDSLYVMAGSTLPRLAHFFYKHLGQALWYHVESNDGNEVTLEETNMLRSACLPDPESFEVRSHFLAVDSSDQRDIDLLKYCAFTIIRGRQSLDVGTGVVFPLYPRAFFSSPLVSHPGNLSDGFVFPLGKSREVIPPGMYFTVKMKQNGKPVPLKADLRVWSCLYGEWTGPGEVAYDATRIRMESQE